MLSSVHRSTPALALAALACAPSLLVAQTTAQAQPIATTATPQPTAPTTPPPELTSRNRWTVRLEPQVWYVAPEGKLQMPGAPAGTPSVKLEALDLEDAQASASGQITIRVPHQDADSWSSSTFWDSGWFFSIGGASFSGDGTSIAPAGGLVIGTINAAAGAAIQTDMDWSTYHAEVGKWIVGSDFDSGGETRLDLYAVVGARLHSQDITIVSGADEINASETFGAFSLGLRLDAKLPADFAAIVDLKVDVWPGDPSLAGFEIAPTFMWEPTPNLGVQIGYRLLIADCETGSEGDTGHYRLDGSLAGLFFGVEIRF